MVARDIALASKDRMREAVAVLHAIAKTEKISSDQASQSITIEGSAREAGLAEWLMGELDKPDLGPYGHGYIMPHDADDVTLVIGGLSVAPIQAGAAQIATPPELQEIAGAIRVLGDVTRTAVYAPASVLAWRGRVWQNDFALWLLRELASPPAVNWTEPISHRLDQASPSVRIFYFGPGTRVSELGQIASSVRLKTHVQRVAAIKAARAIILRGTDIEAAAAELVVAAARR
jgi:hypothetical protein